MKFHSQLKQAAFYLAVLSIGALSFLLVIGPQILNPENISWLKGDASQHYQGWAQSSRLGQTIELATHTSPTGTPIHRSIPA